MLGHEISDVAGCFVESMFGMLGFYRGAIFAGLPVTRAIGGRTLLFLSWGSRVGEQSDADGAGFAGEDGNEYQGAAVVCV